MSAAEPVNLKDITVTLVGAGNMGGAMLRGWLSGGMPASNINVLDPSPHPDMKSYLDRVGIAVRDNAETLLASGVLILAVKPQIMDAVLPTVKSLAGENTVAVSVAAGKTLSSISEPLGNPATVRAMPNTPALVQRGITVACPNDKVSQTQRANVDLLLKSTGSVEWVEDEALIDAVTAVSGSGPAYIFHLAECMAEAGKVAGLPDALALKLARETVSGAGELLRQSDDDPATLRQNVTSPGGTTAAALDVLMGDGAMKKLFEKAILAAKKRSEELS